MRRESNIITWLIFLITPIIITISEVNFDEAHDKSNSYTLSFINPIHNDDSLTFYGSNYVSFVNMTPKLLSEWFPTNMDRCVMNGTADIYTCQSLYNITKPNPNMLYPISAGYQDTLPQTIFKMPMGFGIEYGPKAYNIIHLLRYFHANGMVLISIGDSLALQMMRAIVKECARLYGDEITLTPSFPSPIPDPHQHYHECSIYLKEQFIVKFIFIYNYECQSPHSRLHEAISELNEKHIYHHYVVIANVGVHCHEKKEYETSLRSMFEFVENYKANMTFFYKQTSIQHMESDSGEYLMNATLRKTDRCVPHNYNFKTMYQVVEDNEIYLANRRYVLSNQTLRPINVLPFRYTAEFWDMHLLGWSADKNKTVADCTHFKQYDPIIHQPVFYTLYRHFLKTIF
jgi:hypothetical protein